MNDLLKVLSLPEKPVNTGLREDKIWEKFEAGMGTALPEDYKEIISQYGQGIIDDFMIILNPFTENHCLNLMKQSKDIITNYIEFKDEFPDIHYLPAFPVEGGILPWGITINADELYWQTKGTPNEWSIIVSDRAELKLIEYDLNMTDFLYKVLSKELICPAFPEDFPSTNPEYIV